MQQRMMYVYSRYLDKSDLDKAIHTSARRGPSVVVAITNAGAYTATFEYSTFPSSSVDMLAFAFVIVVGVVRPDSVSIATLRYHVRLVVAAAAVVVVVAVVVPAVVVVLAAD